MGSSYVTFDGIDIGVTGTNVEYGYYLQNVSGTNGSQNNNIKNCQITLNKSNNNSIGIYQNASIAISSSTGANSNNVYRKINIDNSFTGIWLVSQAAFPDINCVIDSCKVGTTANSIGGVGTGATWGIRCDYANTIIISANEVGNITMTGTKNIGGIFLGGCTGLSQVYNNKVHDLKVTSTSTSSAPIGIRIDEPSGYSAMLYNNMIWGFSHGITSPNATLLFRAISINTNGSTGTVNVYNNTAWIASGANPSSAVFSIGSGLANVKNNIFYNTSTAGATSLRYCYYAASGTLNTSDYNELYIPTGTNNYIGNYASANKTLLSDWRTSTNMDANSLNLTLNFTSASNPHLDVNSNCNFDGKGTYILGITQDIDNDIRDLTMPDIGADEFQGGCIAPNVFTVIGGGSFCAAGLGVIVGLNGSQVGVKYQLYRDGSIVVGSPVGGTGSSISFGNQNIAGTYTVKTTSDGCYCIATMIGSAQLNMVPIPDQPLGNTPQVFINGGTISDLQVTGTLIQWYDAATGGNLISSTDSLIDGNTYYASQIVGGCESQNRLAVNVILIHIKVVNIHLFLEGLYNSVSMQMNEAKDGSSDEVKWGYGIADRIQVDLFEENPPYAPIGVSISGIDLTTGGLATFQVSPSWSGNYYIRIRSRNHLETWSTIAVPFSSSTVEYNFTTASMQAYGLSSQVKVSSNPDVYAFYLGDLDQGGWVDSEDFNLFEPYLTAGTVGFVIADFNGSGWVDSDDFNLFELRLTTGAFAQYPGKK